MWFHLCKILENVNQSIDSESRPIVTWGGWEQTTVGWELAKGQENPHGTDRCFHGLAIWFYRYMQMSTLIKFYFWNTCSLLGVYYTVKFCLLVCFFVLKREEPQLKATSFPVVTAFCTHSRDSGRRYQEWGSVLTSSLGGLSPRGVWELGFVLCRPCSWGLIEQKGE